MENFIRVGVSSPFINVADVEHNEKEIIKIIKEANKEKIDVLTFPELCLTGATCGDLFLQSSLIKQCEKSLINILEETKKINIFITLGMPVKVDYKLYNSAVSILNGKILGVSIKNNLQNHNEAYEKRWFHSDDLHLKNIILANQETIISSSLIFTNKNNSNFKIGIEIGAEISSVIPKSSFFAIQGANIILNLSASNEAVGKEDFVKSMIKSQSEKTFTAYCYANAGYGESTTDLVFSGYSFIYEKGKLVAENEKFNRNSDLIFYDVDVEFLHLEKFKNKSFSSTDYYFETEEIIFDLKYKNRKLERNIEQFPFVPTDNFEIEKRCTDILNTQIFGLSKRLEVTNTKKTVIGVSGGLDSTLALLVLVKTFDDLKRDRKDIIGITMPGFGTTNRTYENALKLMDVLKISQKEISIKEASLQHFKNIGHNPDIHDTTYENTQARERTQILMDIGNKEAGMVIGTGDLSEIALGWSTYNGDHMSMYSVNCSIPKTLIRTLVYNTAEKMDKKTEEILKDILNTPVSPELLPPDKDGLIEQKTEDIIGPYELHDFFLYYMFKYGINPKKIIFLATEAFNKKYSEEEIIKWIKIFYRRFFTQQFKRSCSPDGPKVGSIALSPRGDLKMPSDASFNIWLKEIEELN